MSSVAYVLDQMGRIAWVAPSQLNTAYTLHMFCSSFISHLLHCMNVLNSTKQTTIMHRYSQFKQQLTDLIIRSINDYSFSLFDIRQILITDSTIWRLIQQQQWKEEKTKKNSAHDK